MTNPTTSAADREAAKELVEANADRGRSYDNAPDYLETAAIIAKHMAAERERAQRMEEALKAILFSNKGRINAAKPTLQECVRTTIEQARAALEKE